METKELKIKVPKGYEIDKENSTFERIIFKPINKDIIYKEEYFEFTQKEFHNFMKRLKGWEE